VRLAFVEGGDRVAPERCDGFLHFVVDKDHELFDELPPHLHMIHLSEREVKTETEKRDREK
jgi:hypothetical protein